jgi:hypothetical protein
MLTLNVIGPTLLTISGKPIKVSSKGLALLTYLTLEDRPVHRVTLAEIFWPSGGGLGNLRVELSKLRQVGIDLSAERAPLLRSTVRTDLEQLQHWAESRSGGLEWLRGSPLGGLDEAMSPSLLPWLQTRRSQIEQALQQTLQHALAHALAEEQLGQADLLRNRAAALGWTLPDPVLQQKFHPARALAPRLSADLRRAARRAEQAPQVLLLVGRHGSGRKEALLAALENHPWPAIHLDAVAHVNLLVMSLMMRLLPVLREDLRPALQALLARALPADRAMTSLSALLLDHHSPLVVVIHGAESLGDEVSPLFDFALNWPLPLLLVLVSTEAGEVTVTRLLGRHVRPERFSLSRTRPLCADDLRSPHLPSPLPAAAERHLFQVARQSEGWATAALALLNMPQPLAQRVPMPPEVRSVLIGEAYQAMGDHLALLTPLAALPGPFSVDLALGTLRRMLRGAEAEQTLERALSAGLLERIPDHVDVALPNGTFSVPDGNHPLAFRSELQRAALAGTLEPALRAKLRQGPLTPSTPAQSAPLSVQRAGERSALPDDPTTQTTVSLPDGYRLHCSPEVSTLLRLGARGHHPLEVRLSYQPPERSTHWRFTLCLEGSHTGAEAFSLGILDPQGNAPPSPIMVPQEGQWFVASGSLAAPGAPLVIGVRASDLILHLAALEFSPQRVEITSLD